MDRSIFKAYDVRGIVPDTLNEPIVRAIAVAYSELYRPRTVVIGYDARLESPPLAEVLCEGFLRSGVDVIDLGLCGTEEVYFHTFAREQEGVDGGIMVTASHNPKGYNGLKIVEKSARPVGSASGLFAIRDRVAELLALGLPPAVSSQGRRVQDFNKQRFVDAVLRLIGLDGLKPLNVVADCGNGAAGPTLAAFMERLPLNVIAVRDKPDGNFPNGIPNPLLVDKRALTAADVTHYRADVGVAWDGDFDRCFFYDEKGHFIEGVYVVGLLAKAMLAKNPGANIVHDPRLIWDTQDHVRRAGGQAYVSRVGHAFIKQVMREKNAIYGGEMSAHHYFRDFGFCDSGMLTWLHFMSLMSQTESPLSELIVDRLAAFPCSGEINFSVADPIKALNEIETRLAHQAATIDKLDGLSLAFTDWRCNIRPSNTEPLLRLNVETRANRERLIEKVDELSRLIESL